MFFKKYRQLIIGFVLGAVVFSVTPITAAVEEYICHKADYKVVINGSEYTNNDLPILNYNGNTYAPFRSILEKAGLAVNWNSELNQAEVTAKSASVSNILNKGDVNTMSTTTTNIDLTQWVGLREYAINNPQLYQNKLREIEYPSEIYTSSGTTSTIQVDGKIIRVTCIDSVTYLNRDDLKAAGLF